MLMCSGQPGEPKKLRDHGMSLIELCVVLAVVAVLAALAYPSLRSLVLKARRSDAQVALMQLAHAQSRWRSGQAAYAQLAELGLGAQSAQGHYQLAVHSASSSGFVATANAVGSQALDAPCQVLRLVQQAGVISHSSGTDAEHDNADAVNRQCWSL
jgi:type IV pilus assembly protein PilE